jgi:predicted nuclease of predicted toxin-antitoxin system
VRLLIDENVSPLVGDALRAAGYDVSAAAVVCPGARDEGVVSLAIAEWRTIVSEDKDFGDLAFRAGLRPPGLVRIALPGYLPAEKAVRVVDALKGRNIAGVILVVEPTRVRRRRLP